MLNQTQVLYLQFEKKGIWAVEKTKSKYLGIGNLSEITSLTSAITSVSGLLADIFELLLTISLTSLGRFS